MVFGFTTGTLRNSHPYEEIVEIYRTLGCSAVEISPSHIFDVQERPWGFEYVSTHDSPQDPYVRGDVKANERLEKLAEQVACLGLGRVVLHPNRVHDWALLLEYAISWGIENLDARNTVFRTPEELLPVLDTHNLPLVLDVNHCYTHDPSLALARRFQKRFAGRIVEQHVSGYRDSTDSGRHLPLALTEQGEIFSVLDQTIPTIIEIDECSVETLAQEIAWFRARVASVT